MYEIKLGLCKHHYPLDIKSYVCKETLNIHLACFIDEYLLIEEMVEAIINHEVIHIIIIKLDELYTSLDFDNLFNEEYEGVDYNGCPTI